MKNKTVFLESSPLTWSLLVSLLEKGIKFILIKNAGIYEILSEKEVKKVFIKDKEVTNVVIDPTGETGEVNMADNVFPKKPTENKFDELKKN